jgi:ribosome-binding protein aMBF1 (putative translation factor)
MHSKTAIHSNIAMPKRGPKTSRRLDDRLSSLREAVGSAPDFDDLELFGLIAERVAERRKAWGVSQGELAELCGTTQSAIARVERGARPPRIDTLARIAAALDCELVIELRPRTNPPDGGKGGGTR